MVPRSEYVPRTISRVTRWNERLHVGLELGHLAPGLSYTLFALLSFHPPRRDTAPLCYEPSGFCFPYAFPFFLLATSSLYIK
ncbi:hypothetical protein BC826DRAFT_995311 [Russula brevipes]|nr:hypothetical protein BC826DRAFT_995311 [Russula brevipes]